MCKHTKSSNKRIDKCLKPLLNWLEEEEDEPSNIFPSEIVASCCGHGKYPMTVVIRDENGNHWELLSQAPIERKRRFYVKDKKGHYYIPEISNSK